MTEIEYAKDMPELVRIEVEKLLPTLLWLAPSWLHRICVCWNDYESESSLTAHTNYAYRWVQFTIRPRWLNGDDRKRRIDLIHEMLHASFCPFADWANERIKTLADEEKMKTLLELEWVERIEMAVTDMTKMIAERESTQ